MLKMIGNLVFVACIGGLIYNLSSYIDWEREAVKDFIEEEPILKHYGTENLDVLKCKNVTYVGHKGTERATFVIKGNPLTGGNLKLNYFNFPESCDVVPIEENPFEKLNNAFEKADKEFEEKVQPHLDDMEELSRRNDKTEDLLDQLEEYSNLSIDDPRVKSILKNMEDINNAPLPSSLKSEIPNIDWAEETRKLDKLTDKYNSLDDSSPMKAIVRQQYVNQLEYMKSANVGTKENPISYKQKLEEEISYRTSELQDQIFVYSTLQDSYYRKAELKEEIRENVRFLKLNTSGLPANELSLSDKEFEDYLSYQLNLLKSARRDFETQKR